MNNKQLATDYGVEIRKFHKRMIVIVIIGILLTVFGLYALLQPDEYSFYSRPLQSPLAGLLIIVSTWFLIGLYYRVFKPRKPGLSLKDMVMGDQKGKSDGRR